MTQPRQAASVVLDLLLAVRCAGCGAVGRPVCADCRARWQQPRAVGALGVPGAPVPVVAAADYPAELGRLIRSAKDAGGWGLVPPLGEALALAVAHALDRAGGPPAARLIPVPIRSRDRLRRGGDPVAAIAQAAAGALSAAGCPTTVDRWLRWRRSARDQVGLSAAQRHRNVAGAIEVAGRPADGGAALLLVDDLVTTGATAMAALAALAAAGLRPVAVACIAHPGGGLSTGAPGAHLR